MSDKKKMLKDGIILCVHGVIILLMAMHGWLLVRSVPGAGISIPLMPEDQNKGNR